MNVLVISTDRKLYHKESAVRERMRWYGTLAEELHIIVFSLRKLEYPSQPFEEKPNIYFYPTNSRSRWLYITDAVWIGLKILNGGGDWILSTQDPFETGVVGWVLARLKRTKLHIQVHTDLFSKYFMRSHFLNRPRVFIARFLLPRADSIRVVSLRIKKKIESLVPRRVPIYNFPIFVDVNHIKETALSYDLHKEHPEFDCIVLQLSRLEPEKNIGLGIYALQEIIKKYPKTGLVIIGSGTQRKYLENLIAHLGLQKNVLLTGWKEDIISAFRTADIFLLTSKYEGYAMTLVEAVSARLPIVTTDVGLVGDILKDNQSALVCEPEDSKCISRKLEKLIENPDLRKQLAVCAKESVEHNTVRDQRKYIEMYRQCWEGH